MEVYITKPWFFTRTLALLHKRYGEFHHDFDGCNNFVRYVVIQKTCSIPGADHGFY